MRETVRRRRGYVVIPNRTALEAPLSMRALGLLVVLLARPDGATFDMRVIAEGEGREGRDALLRARRELENLGLVRQFRYRTADGLTRTETVVADTAMTVEEAAAVVASRLPPGSGSPTLVGPADRAAPGSGYQTPVNQTPVNQTPADSTALPTGGHSHQLRDERNYSAAPENAPLAAPRSPLGWSPDGRHRVCDTVHSDVQRCPRLDGPPAGWRPPRATPSSGDPRPPLPPPTSRPPVDGPRLDDLLAAAAAARSAAASSEAGPDG